MKIAEKVAEHISSQCIFKSRYLRVNHSNMHYYDEGVGSPVLFLHGVPTSAYLWRNIILPLKSFARCIAPDLIGMGKSDKPNISYCVSDHIAYIDQFIETLNLNNITLVMHGFGSIIGFDYARRHEKNIKSLIFYESFIQPTETMDDLSLPVQQLATLLKHKEASYRAIVEQNYLVEKLLPNSVIRNLSEDEMNHYREPFLTVESRKLLWQYINDLPLQAGSSNINNLIRQYSDWLQKTPIPKLMLYAIPGFVTTIKSLQWAREHINNIKLSELEDAMHLAQESMPDLFSDALIKFLT